MDREQEEMQFLGVFGIFSEAYKLILSRRKIFSQITLSLILPLSFLVLIHIEVSDVLFDKIIDSEIDRSQTQAGTTKYNKLTDVISSEWTTFWLFKAAYFIFLLVLSLLSTAAVVYTIACVYTARHDLSYKKVMSVVPKVWKRLIVTFLWTLLAIFAYNVVAFFLVVALTLTLVVFFSSGHAFERFFLLVCLIAYALGLVYLTLLWHLAGVVSVLEDASGIKAMRKSKALMKGKMWTAVAVLAVLMAASFGLQFLFQMCVVHGSGIGGVGRVVLGVLCLLVSVKLMLLGLVVQTIIYFVCKSYHHENIDKSALSDHLEAYLGEYVPLTAKDVQLEQYQV